MSICRRAQACAKKYETTIASHPHCCHNVLSEKSYLSPFVCPWIHSLWKRLKPLFTQCRAISLRDQLAPALLFSCLQKSVTRQSGPGICVIAKVQKTSFHYSEVKVFGRLATCLRFVLCQSLLHHNRRSFDMADNLKS